MNTFPEYCEYDGLGLAELVKTKQVESLELIEAAISRIESVNPHLNAVVYKMYDRARSLAGGSLPEGSFQGVPFLVKDLTIAIAGIPTSHGNRLLRNVPADRNSEIVNRFQSTGVVFLGKTNTPEFGLTPYTESETLGIARNPWNLACTTGGSSGGSAAAVAAGMVPMASASDAGGSIRIPASCCGVFGLKPTRGRTPNGPDVGEIWRGFGAIGLVTRSVRDSAAMLDAISGADVGAPYVAPAQARSFLAEVTTLPKQLRIAFTSQPLLGRTVHPDCIQGLNRTVSLLQALGHELIEAAPQLEREAFATSFITIVAAEMRARIEKTAHLARRKVSSRDFEAGTYSAGLLGKSLSASDYVRAANYLQVAARKIAQFFEQYDVLLTPTLAQPPVLHGSLKPPRVQQLVAEAIGALNAGWLLKLLDATGQIAQRSFDFTPYTSPFNVTGQPAMSVPLHWSDRGLPIGMQFVGRFGDEATLFQLAGQLESAQPWQSRLPPIVAERSAACNGP
ncbi:amidase [Synechococcus sp. PCC 7336]|uniref:amidase n=1 Tax=Synechococcus sp. PCC 7336 TaxID=195250 RepID=UPI00034C9932|nr:amidase [Synechococcus sp. PCC 7336]